MAYYGAVLVGLRRVMFGQDGSFGNAERSTSCTCYTTAE